VAFPELCLAAGPQANGQDGDEGGRPETDEEDESEEKQDGARLFSMLGEK
jgi:ribosomal protein L12E/L44/L45/RPP1/RPP2